MAALEPRADHPAPPETPFDETMVDRLNAASTMAMVSIGHRTGLLDAMDDVLPPPSTASPEAPRSPIATSASGSGQSSPHA